MTTVLSEELRNYISWEVRTGLTTDARFVGPSPRLNAPDAEAAYAEMDVGPSTEYIIPTKTLAPGPLPARVTISAQVRLRGGSGQRVELFLSNPTGGDYIFALSEPLSDGVWTTLALTLDPIEVAALSAASSSVGYTLGALGSFGGTDIVHWDVSWISIGRPRPLRWRQRDDGLGVGGPGAARGRSSVQMSNRGRGYV